MKISTKGKYAVEALLYMAINPQEEKWNIKSISEKVGVTERYLEQIFHLLRKAELLDTVRGPKGGYFLNRPIDELRIGEIIRAVEVDIIPVPCATCEDACTCNIKDICATRGLWYRLLEAICGVIDHITLKDLSEKYRGDGGQEDEDIY